MAGKYRRLDQRQNAEAEVMPKTSTRCLELF